MVATLYYYPAKGVLSSAEKIVKMLGNVEIEPRSSWFSICKLTSISDTPLLSYCNPETDNIDVKMAKR